MKRWIRDLLIMLLCGIILLAYGLKYMNEPLIAGGIVLVAMSPYIAKKSNEAEMREDERDLQLAGKSALTAMLTVCMASLIIGMIFVSDHERIGDWAKYSGYTLMAVATTLFAAMAVSYAIMNRKMVKEASQ